MWWLEGGYESGLEDDRLLRDDADVAKPPPNIQVLKVVVLVNDHRTRVRIIEAEEEGEEGRLAAA